MIRSLTDVRRVIGGYRRVNPKDPDNPEINEALTFLWNKYHSRRVIRRALRLGRWNPGLISTMEYKICGKEE